MNRWAGSYSLILADRGEHGSTIQLKNHIFPQASTKGRDNAITLRFVKSLLIQDSKWQSSYYACETAAFAAFPTLTTILSVSPKGRVSSGISQASLSTVMTYQFPPKLRPFPAGCTLQ